MTDDDVSLDVMATPLLDDAAATAVLRGERPTRHHDGLTPVAVLARAARTPGTLDETEISTDLLDLLVASSSHPVRVRGAGRRTHRLAAVAAALLVSTAGVAAAATNHLPAPLQDAVAAAVSHAGIDLPRSDDRDPATNPEDVGNGAEQSPDTVPSPKLTPPTPDFDVAPGPTTGATTNSQPSTPAPPISDDPVCGQPAACASSPPTVPGPSTTSPAPPPTSDSGSGAPTAPPTTSPPGPSAPTAVLPADGSSSTPTTRPVITDPGTEAVAVTSVPPHRTSSRP